MTATTIFIDFSGDLLLRGFWLYAWEVRSPDEQVRYYVGRTGDSSSIKAQSPFNRMGQHLGFNKSTQQLRRHLENARVKPEACSFRLVAHGPILEEALTRELHRERRDIVAALEKALAEAMRDSGYTVMNKVNSRMPQQTALFGDVRAAFAEHFPKLQGGVGIAEVMS